MICPRLVKILKKLSFYFLLFYDEEPQRGRPHPTMMGLIIMGQDMGGSY
jgi:hypothetical protein